MACTICGGKRYLFNGRDCPRCRYAGPDKSPQTPGPDSPPAPWSGMTLGKADQILQAHQYLLAATEGGNGQGARWIVCLPDGSFGSWSRQDVLWQAVALQQRG